MIDPDLASMTLDLTAVPKAFGKVTVTLTS
jgi:hypothetical protein